MRKKFLIKPALQIRHLTWTLIVTGLTFAACYFLFEHQISKAVLSGTVTPENWVAIRATFRFGFGFALLILLSAVGLENYLFFHTIAGPLYALEKGLKQVAKGDFQTIVKIRENDQLGDLITAFEDMKRSIGERIELQEKTAQLLVTELKQLLENASVENINNMRQTLIEIRTRLENKAA